MKILIAPDKFKDSLTSAEACKAIRAGIEEVTKGLDFVLLPIADGGEGFLEVVKAQVETREVTIAGRDPLMRPQPASFLMTTEGKKAFIEMAAISGLQLLHPSEYNPLKTNSYGTGQLIKAALEKSADFITIGIGGSATNDGGTGMAAALGLKFLDKNGKEVFPSGENLTRISAIDRSSLIDLTNTKIIVACDVTNPLTGPQGATMIYRKQKGAKEDDLLKLEEGMLNYAEVLLKETGKNVSNIPGAGAAGGLASACLAFLNAELRSGIDLVLELSKARELVKAADLIITGEGKLDRQSFHGKVISGLSQLALDYQKPIIAFCGKIDQELEYKQFLNQAIQISPYETPIGEAKTKAFELLRTAAKNWAMTNV